MLNNVKGPKSKRGVNEMMKRIAIVLALALALTIAFAGVALAEQKSVGPGVGTGTGTVPGVNPSGYAGTTDTSYVTGAAYNSPGPSYPVNNGTIYIPSDNVSKGGTTRIHTNFTKNTDACAACHATHTGVGGKLLQWETTTRTCVACHDGTVTGTYNVIGGYIGATSSRTKGGLFAPEVAGSDWSRHAVFDSVKTNAAPGGARYTTAADDSKGKWTSDFSCASCHSPHGQGGNARLLNPDPNGAATLNKQSNFTLTPIDTVTFVAYNGAAASGNEYTWIKGYPYSVSTQVYANGALQSSGYTINNTAGYTVVTFTAAPTQPVTANFVPSVRVKMAVSGFLTAGESVTYKSGINQFCGTCHTDYNTESTAGNSTTRSDEHAYGYYTSAYRHQVGMTWSTAVDGLKFEGGSNNGTVVCLTCHVAHGTNRDYRLGALSGVDGGYWTASTVVEARGDGKSALKRKPNMGTCETCHQKGAGNEGYAANSQ